MSLLGKRKTRYLRYILYVRWFSVFFSERPPKNIHTGLLIKLYFYYYIGWIMASFIRQQTNRIILFYIFTMVFLLFYLFTERLWVFQSDRLYILYLRKKSFKTFSSCSKQYHTSNGTRMLVFFFLHRHTM